MPKAIFDFSYEAREDLFRIWNYGADIWGEEAANQYYLKLHRHFEQLAEEPFLYPEVAHLGEGYRRSICENEVIYYRIVDKGIFIMAIIGRQDITRRL